MIDSGVRELFAIIVVIVNDIKEKLLDLTSDAGRLIGLLDQGLELGIEGAGAALFAGAVEE